MIRVLIVDDYAAVRQGLRALIATAPDMKIVGVAGDGRRAAELAAALQPDIVTMDLAMPGMGGIKAIRAVCQVARRARVLVLSDFAEPEQVFAALRAGAMGYLLKDAVLTNVVKAIRELYRGRMIFHPSIEQMALTAIREMGSDVGLGAK